MKIRTRYAPSPTVKAGSVKNVATATGETVDPDGEPEIVPGETDTPISEPEEEPEDDDIPQTGDATDMGPWAALMVTSMAGMGIAMMYKRRKEEEE